MIFFFHKRYLKKSKHVDLDCVSSHNSISRKEDSFDDSIELSKNN